ncbi:hypothetical protein LT493_23065 [Streptomyces tricolor]|nr:hypothetical protein [Streptomyces tricolor]
MPTCLVLGPEALFHEEVVRPVCEELQLSLIRADQLTEPGPLGEQLVRHLLEEDVVVADLTGGHPSVALGLGVRHAAGRSTVLLGQAGTVPAGLDALPALQFPPLPDGRAEGARPAAGGPRRGTGPGRRTGPRRGGRRGRRSRARGGRAPGRPGGERSRTAGAGGGGRDRDGGDGRRRGPGGGGLPGSGRDGGAVHRGRGAGQPAGRPHEYAAGRRQPVRQVHRRPPRTNWRRRPGAWPRGWS